MPDTPSGKIPLDDLLTFEKRIKGKKVLNCLAIESLLLQIVLNIKNPINYPYFKLLQAFKKDV